MNVLKLVGLMLISVFLSGCFFQEVENTDIRKAIYLCGSYENIDNITEIFNGDGSVKCISGEYKTIHEIHIVREEPTK